MIDCQKKLQKPKNQQKKISKKNGKISEEFKLKKTAYYRYLKISTIRPEYEELINDGKISLKAAEIIASFPQDIQFDLITNHKHLLTTKRIARLSSKTPPEKIVSVLEHEEDITSKYTLEAAIAPTIDEVPVLFYVNKESYGYIKQFINTYNSTKEQDEIKDIPIMIKSR